MRFNWHSIIQASSLMASQPDIKGPISGNGYQVKRNPKKGKNQQFVIVITEGDYSEPESESTDG